MGDAVETGAESKAFAVAMAMRDVDMVVARAVSAKVTVGPWVLVFVDACIALDVIELCE